MVIPAEVVRVAFMPDGRTLIAAGRDGTVRAWLTASGLSDGIPLTGQTGAVTCLSVHPGGRRLATGGTDGVVRLWDVPTRSALLSRRPVAGSPATGAPVSAVAFSPDGSTLAVGIAGLVYVWDVGTGALIGPLTHDCGHRAAVTDLAFSADGEILAGACADNVVQAWNAVDGRRIGRPMFHSGPALRVAFSPDGRTIASADGGAQTPVRLWAATTGAPERTLSGHTLPVTGVAYQAQGALLASGGADGSVLLWNPRTGVLLHRLLQGAAVQDVCLSPDGRTLAAVTPRAIRLWDVASL